MTDLRARLADALQEHRIVGIEGTHRTRCRCGHEGSIHFEAHDEHQADVLLSLPGIAIVDVDDAAAVNDQILAAARLAAAKAADTAESGS